jgi:hypothetical protein
MAEREFHLRLSCNYQDPDNSIAELDVELLTEEGWETLDLNTRTAGFLLFVYTIFTCQHTYMRTNCAERGLVLDAARATLDLVAGEDWIIHKLHSAFDGRLKAGRAADTDVAFIVDRMTHCPVAGNLIDIPDKRITLQLD